MVRRIVKILAVLMLAFAVSAYADGILVKIDDLPLTFDVPPVIKEGRTLVPVRKIFEELGCKLEWLQESETVIATKDSKIMALRVGRNIILSTDVESGENKTFEIDVAPCIIDDRVLVPLRAVSELLDYSVSWDSEALTVNIYSD